MTEYIVHRVQSTEYRDHMENTYDLALYRKGLLTAKLNSQG